MEYEILSALNESHKVYLIRDKADGKVYVQKEVSTYNPSVYATLAQYPVPGIPRIIDVFEDRSKQTLTVTEEYISGRTLEDLTESEGPLPEETVISYILRLCDILKQLHGFNPPIIHRDITPANVMLSEDDRLMLIDLNAGKFAEKGRSKDTRLLGTPGYAAPEQLGFGSSAVTTDIYALGMLMKALLTADTSLSTPYSGYLKGIIGKCTCLSPKKRYRNVNQLTKALNRAAFLHKNRMRFLSCAALIFLAVLILTADFITKGLRPLPAPSWDTEEFTAPDVDTAKSDMLCGSYRGSDGGGLTINPDGSCVYYCPSRQYSEIPCPWTFRDDIITVKLSKLHCDICARLDESTPGKLTFVSDSRNWNEEVYEKLNDPDFSYESKVLFAYDKNLSFGSDGGYEFSAGGFDFHIPRHYMDFPDAVDSDKDRYIFITSDADEMYSSQLYFFRDKDFDPELLDDFFRGCASSFAMDFIDNIDVTDVESRREGRATVYSCQFTGIYNKGFEGMAGNKAGGTIVFMYDHDSTGVVKIIFAQVTGKGDDLSEEFRDIVDEAVGLRNSKQ